jgi:hypothetical protein
MLQRMLQQRLYEHASMVQHCKSVCYSQHTFITQLRDWCATASHALTLPTLTSNHSSTTAHHAHPPCHQRCCSAGSALLLLPAGVLCRAAARSAGSSAPARLAAHLHWQAALLLLHCSFALLPAPSAACSSSGHHRQITSPGEQRMNKTLSNLTQTFPVTILAKVATAAPLQASRLDYTSAPV